MSSNTTLVKKGNKIIMKTDTPNDELDDRGVIMEIAQLEGGIGQNRHTIVQAQNQIRQAENELAMMVDLLKKMRKFEEWAMELQESKMKAHIDEVLPKAIEAVEKDYKHDHALTEEGNSIQKFAQLQNYIARNRDLAKRVAAPVINKMVFHGSYLKNPWKK